MQSLRISRRIRPSAHNKGLETAWSIAWPASNSQWFWPTIGIQPSEKKQPSTDSDLLYDAHDASKLGNVTDCCKECKECKELLFSEEQGELNHHEALHERPSVGSPTSKAMKIDL